MQFVIFLNMPEQQCKYINPWGSVTQFETYFIDFSVQILAVAEKQPNEICCKYTLPHARVVYALVFVLFSTGAFGECTVCALLVQAYK